jgi:5,10-methenyltetrahydrofolate synthetase
VSFIVSINPSQTALSSRQGLRQRLLAEREAFASSPEGALAAASLATHLSAVLADLAPECLGVYWPVRSEFNAASFGFVDGTPPPWTLALPFAHRTPREMHFRLWSGETPSLKDECGIFTATGKPVVPDVVLAPCVGYTDDGFRLGYGGGYFDRYLAAHPQVTAVGVSWSVGRVDAAEFAAQPHDQPLMLIVTEKGVVG